MNKIVLKKRYQILIGIKMCMHILFSCYCKKYVCMMKMKRNIAMLNKLTIEHVDEDLFVIIAELTENELPCYDFMK
jgi:hypothetical protein